MDVCYDWRARSAFGGMPLCRLCSVFGRTYNLSARRTGMIFVRLKEHRRNTPYFFSTRISPTRPTVDNRNNRIHPGPFIWCPLMPSSLARPFAAGTPTPALLHVTLSRFSRCSAPPASSPGSGGRPRRTGCRGPCPRPLTCS